MTRRERSIAPDWFEGLYRDDPDPWAFETSDYEAAKYAHTLASLPPGPIPSALEVGCSIGVLTAMLAPRCVELLAVDVSEVALARARARCADLRQVRFERRVLPAEFPRGRFDLVMLSEVVYYWDRSDVERLAARLAEATGPGALLLLVHYTDPTDYPLGGDEAVEALRAALGDRVEEVRAERRPRYRLDLWRRGGSGGA